MTHKQIWLTIGEAFETEPEDRTKGQGNLTRVGLCFAYKKVSGSEEKYINFVRFCLRCLEKGQYYWLPICNDDDWNRSYDLLRATFAYFMAAMTEKEFNDMIGV